ncbi:TonB-dependent receptor [Marilutibacter alkalisoli]|uniref:TonB-dependent receptor n=1 Tax=Marilutibacter alkalisoli TaxID=2591633 RepID=A0A514BPX6_9GAMM|nr:TonB-dependent receptor [Lysobacter alkalisoli]QDH69426.1 TonB-dependent receptor [Lysobacter alkalisoli]
MTHSNRVRLSRLTLGLLAVLATAPAFAQQTSAGVGGRVVGADGQPVAGAEITIVHAESGTVSRATTDANGRYNARGLRVGGPYNVTVSKAGEGTDSRDNVFLTLSNVTQVDATLRGDVTTLESVMAVAMGGSEVFSADKMGAGTNVSQQQLEGLPSVQRNIQDYVRLDPRIAQTDKGRGEISAGGQNTRFNAIRVDGVTINDTFGLEANNLPTFRQPVSMDAIEQIRVDLSNYDTTITGATGAVVDAVTKSGTNEFHGSVYGAYRDNSMIRKNTDGSKFSGFKDELTYGATLGGPLVKDKLFFFVNYEKFERSTPGASFGPIGSGASNIVNIHPDEIAEVRQIARDVYGIDIGNDETPDSINEKLEEYAAKIDWNINDNHRASLRYSKVEQAQPFLSGSGASSIGLSTRWYTVNKNVETTVAQLFSDWSDNFSTEFKVGHRKYDSLSTIESRMPAVSIGFGDLTGDRDEPRTPTLNFGADEFRHGNQVGTKTTNALGLAHWYMGDHTLKFGFDWESNDVFNLFAQNIFGAYSFASTRHFRDGEYWQYRLNAPVPGMPFESITMNYKHDNLGLYVQDTWAVNYNLNLMFGLRVDIPSMDDVGTHNLLVQEIYGRDNRKTLDGNNLVQPRFGFNYTFDSDRPTQLRGGFGLFQGAAANVWIGNSYQNAGFGLIGYNQQIDPDMTDAEREAIWASLPVTMDPDNPTTPPPAAGFQMMVNLMDDGMRQPSVWKTNLAFERELPWFGMVASAELLLTKVKDGLHFERLDLGAPTGFMPDGREMYWGNPYTRSGVRANGSKEIQELIDAGQLPAGYESVTGWHNDGVILLKNTSKGHTQQLTLSLDKPMTENWAWTAAYTFTKASEVSPLTSSRAISNWNGRMVYNPNEDVASRSNYEIRDRFIGVLNWQKAFFGDNRTKVGLIYEGRSGRPYSWGFRNDANGDGYVNDLFYVPNGPGDVIFRDAAQEAAFFEMLARTPELARYRGRVVDRNSGTSSWVNTFDLRISQELPGFFTGHKAEITFDVMNIGNLLNKDWGRIEEVGFPFRRRVAEFDGIDEATGKYKYNYTGVDGEFLYDNTGQSRWALQATLHYRF